VAVLEVYQRYTLWWESMKDQRIAIIEIGAEIIIDHIIIDQK